jgi:hypothetical protein
MIANRKAIEVMMMRGGRRRRRQVDGDVIVGMTRKTEGSLSRVTASVLIIIVEVDGVVVEVQSSSLEWTHSKFGQISSTIMAARVRRGVPR